VSRSSLNSGFLAARLADQRGQDHFLLALLRIDDNVAMIAHHEQRLADHRW
jgi:hypothetical protein